MSNEKNHDYHILDPSLWPFLSAVGAFVMLFGAVLYMHGSSILTMAIGLLIVLYCMFAWWSDVVIESKDGDHTPVVQIGLRYGVIMFITSEVMFFLAWFWTFFQACLVSDGSCWRSMATRRYRNV
jgi:cytochrome c oxidase subunit 3